MAAGHRLILHVGAPKCGSSSLQAALSQVPDFTSRSGERFRYVVIAGDGALLAGAEVVRAGRAAVCRYVNAINLADMARLDAPTLGDLSVRLESMLTETSVILSCEGWLEDASAFDLCRLLAAITRPVEVVVYVRPQPEFLNASWWQWAAWSQISFDLWIFLTDLSRTCLWAKLIEAWQEVRGVTRVDPRFCVGDIVANFFETLDCAPPAAIRLNRSLSGPAVRLLQRHPRLRPDPHASEIDFVLERALADQPETLPWVQPLDHVRYVLDQARADNLRLMDMMAPPDRAAMEADPRWWSLSAYADRIVAPADPQPADAGEADALAAALADALLAAERKIATLLSERGDPVV